MVMPNINRPITVAAMQADWASEREKGEEAIRIWASQHLNIEIGRASTTTAGAAPICGIAGRRKLDLDSLLERCEVVTIGIDGGGLDDLLGLAVIGREKVTRQWLSWCYGWADPKVLERRKDIAANSRFRQGRLVSDPRRRRRARRARRPGRARRRQRAAAAEKRDRHRSEQGRGVVRGAVCRRRHRRHDPPAAAGPGAGAGGLRPRRKLADGTFWHADQALMSWVVGNAKTEQRGNADMITKQVAGRAKIDPLIALFRRRS
jgi:phage terminase large subunit-like protein